MKKPTLFLALFLSIVSAIAQENPFADYGYTPKIATLSQGQYNESFDNDSIVQIGSVLFNTNTKQIVAFVKTDTLYSEATLEPDVVSRWMSPDPLAAKYPNLSPYVFAGNSPILFVDYDGRDYGVYINHETKTIVIKATFYTTRSLTESRSISDQTYNRAVLAAKYYENIKAQYIVKNDLGEETIYSVSFDIDVKEADPNRRSVYESAETDPEGNMFMSGIPGQHVTTEAGHKTGPRTIEREGKTINGYVEGLTDDKQYIYVEGARALENPKSFYILDIHEMGHVFTSLVEEFHNQDGTSMQSDEHQNGGKPGLNLPNGFIENILSNVGLGSAPVGELKPNAQQHTSGTAPTNFNNGTITTIQNNNLKR